MLFSEVYSGYFNAVAQILAEAVKAPVSRERLLEIVREKGFAESILTIPDAMTEKWQLLHPDGTTALKSPPSMPLTQLQLRWLKALTLDSRFKLFDLPELEGVDPLFTPDRFCFYDRYTDGDDFGNPTYIQNFRTILRALQQKRKLRIIFESGKGAPHRWLCIPINLEYSPKDDKFRLIIVDRDKNTAINLGRIKSCSLAKPFTEEELAPIDPRKEPLVLEITDGRNALERVLLHFSHLQKEVEQLDETHYRLTLRYDREDETELVIRVLSFGPFVKVLEPQCFAKKVKERLLRQLEFTP